MKEINLAEKMYPYPFFGGEGGGGHRATFQPSNHNYKDLALAGTL